MSQPARSQRSQPRSRCPPPPYTSPCDSRLLGCTPQVRVLHFQPPGLRHALTPAYPQLDSEPEANDGRLRPLRQRLHALFGLPPDRPLLRSPNAVEYSAGAEGGEGAASVARLRDVHVTLAAPGAAGAAALRNVVTMPAAANATG
jgi:hypothetical protein